MKVRARSSHHYFHQPWSHQDSEPDQLEVDHLRTWRPHLFDIHIKRQMPKMGCIHEEFECSQEQVEVTGRRLSNGG